MLLGNDMDSVSSLAKRHLDRPMTDHRASSRAHQLVFRVTPLLCVLLTVVVVLLSTTWFSRGVVCFFTYSLIHLEGNVYVETGSERNVVTLVVMLYLPVIYIWKATGRLAKVKGGCAKPEPLFHWHPWQRWQPRPLKLKGQKAVTAYLRHLWSLNLKVWRNSDYWNLLIRWSKKRSAVKATKAKRCSTKHGSGKANIRLQEARKGGQKDWKELKKAWELKSWTESHGQVLSQYNSRFSLYRRLPLKSLSRAWGRFNSLRLPVWLRAPAFRLYIWMFSCQLDEAACTDLKSYNNLSEFFRRQLKRGVRPVHPSHCMVSPADGRVLHHGVVDKGILEQVKGVTYSLRGFLGPQEGLLCDPNESSDTVADAAHRLRRVSSLHLMLGVAFDADLDLLTPKSSNTVEYPDSNDQQSYVKRLLVHPENVLHYCIIYLAPGDYHRFHSPADWTVFARRHFPGELFSVNPGVARWLQGLFNFNERAVYTGRWRHGFFSMTPVGATNVGSINVYFDEDLSTNNGAHHAGSYYDEYFCSKNGTKRGLRVHKGQSVGDFNLGSTIVLLFEAPCHFQFEVEVGCKVKVGQSLGIISRSHQFQ